MKSLKEILISLDGLSDIELFVIDLFCGAGGLSEGVEEALLDGKKCAKVVCCVNHDRNAILSHNANIPDALHFIEDIRTLELSPIRAIVDRIRELYPDSKIMLHASLECTNFSKAKGGQPRDADSRTLAEHLFRYIDVINQNMKIWGVRCGIDPKKMHPHAFRHFFAKMFLKKNKDVIQLADLLGHGSIDTTRIYLQRSYDEQKRDFNKNVTW